MAKVGLTSASFAGHSEWLRGENILQIGQREDFPRNCSGTTEKRQSISAGTSNLTDCRLGVLNGHFITCGKVTPKIDANKGEKEI